MRKYVELHAIQTYPPGLPNRDANNQAKTVTYGSVLRARISSQSLRRAQRVYMRELLSAELSAIRTRRVPALTVDELVTRGWDREDAVAATVYAMELMGLKMNAKRPEEETAVLLFVASTAPRDIAETLCRDSQQIIEAANQWIQKVEEVTAANKDKKKAQQQAAPTADDPAAITKSLHQSLDHVNVADIALFGRMIAEIKASPNVEGALQVAHAFSVDAYSGEPDFFVAVDDGLPHDEIGTGMMGYTDVGSHTMYRWAALDIEALQEHCPNVPVEHIVAAYIQAFALANPTAKTTGSGTAASTPSTLIAAVTSRPVQMADAFVEPIRFDERSVDNAAEQRLLDRWAHTRTGWLTANGALWSANPNQNQETGGGLTRVVSNDQLVAHVLNHIRG